MDIAVASTDAEDARASESSEPERAEPDPRQEQQQEEQSEEHVQSEEEEEEEEEEQQQESEESAQSLALYGMIDHYRPMAARAVEDDLERMDKEALYAFLMSEANKMRGWTGTVANIEEELRDERERFQQAAGQDGASADRDLFISDDTVLAQNAQARRLIARLQDRAGSLGLGMRKLRSLFSSTSFTWADHKLFRPRLRDYLESGVGISNLYKARVAHSYLQLRDDLKFSPDDLTVDRALFSCSHLRLFYGITWRQLLVDYAVGPRDYLVHMRLSLEDLCMLGLTIDVLVSWPWKQAFQEMGREVPGKRSMDPRLVSMRTPLARELFMECGHYAPDDWTMYMGVDYHTLLDDIGLRPKDPWRLWGERYFMTAKDMARAFGYRSHSKEPTPFVVAQPRKRRKHGGREGHRRRRRRRRRRRDRDKGDHGESEEPAEKTDVSWWPWSNSDDTDEGETSDSGPLPAPHIADNSSDSSDSEIFPLFASLSALRASGKDAEEDGAPKEDRKKQKKKKKKKNIGKNRAGASDSSKKPRSRNQMAVL